MRVSTRPALRSSISSSSNSFSGIATVAAVDRDDVAVDVHPHRAGLQVGGHELLRLAAAAQHRTDPGHQLARGVGLGDVVVGAELQADHLVDLAVLGGQHDHRDVGPRPRSWRQTSVPGQARQHQVEQDEVGAVAVELLEGGRAVVGDGDLEALLAEHVGQRVAERLFVLDDEDAGHAVLSFGWRCAARRPVPAGDVAVGPPPARQRRARRCAESGSRRVKVEPWPSTLHTVTSPPWLAATCLTMREAEARAAGGRERAGSTR